MAATRTQSYLTAEQRARLDEIERREGKPLAALIRTAVDEHLEHEALDVDKALAATFGAVPDAEVPPRSEWDREF